MNDEQLIWEMCAGRLTWNGVQWVKKTPNPLWDQIEKESKSGEELYQRLLEAGYFKSDFPKGFYGTIER